MMSGTSILSIAVMTLAVATILNALQYVLLSKRISGIWKYLGRGE